MICDIKDKILPAGFEAIQCILIIVGNIERERVFLYFTSIYFKCTFLSPKPIVISK
ncbi:hypothetical protein JCM10003_2032 [Bacteroides pyogenes JCM 10003]|nr:hypothetical protein JCM10003_2032 [Bacteroides pyogenes JCM 10003]